MKEQLGKALIPREFLDKVLIHAVGWVKLQADGLLERGQLAAIPVAKFRAELVSFTKSLVFSAVLADLAGPALTSISDVDANKTRNYVRQLDLISVRDDRKLRAVSAYLRASVNRSEWGRLALVHEHSLDDFERRLLEYWDNSRTQCEISHKTVSSEERGKFLLAECMKFSQHLQGLQVPYDFAEGCFHALADELLVGWHPDFEKLTTDWK